MDSKQTEKKTGGTFVVRVDSRERATWQGQVIWTDQNRKQYFRSSLELLRLMEDAMNAGEDKDAGGTA